MPESTKMAKILHFCVNCVHFPKGGNGHFGQKAQKRLIFASTVYILTILAILVIADGPKIPKMAFFRCFVATVYIFEVFSTQKKGYMEHFLSKSTKKH